MPNVDDDALSTGLTPTPAGDPSRELIDRIRTLLPRQQPREIRMFGTLALMLDDVMAVAVRKDGSLLVRVDPAEDADLLRRPAASRAEMGTGRSMGAGWIRVEAHALRSDTALAGWLEAATRSVARRGPAHSEGHAATGTRTLG